MDTEKLEGVLRRIRALLRLAACDGATEAEAATAAAKAQALMEQYQLEAVDVSEAKPEETQTSSNLRFHHSRVPAWQVSLAHGVAYACGAFSLYYQGAAVVRFFGTAASIAVAQETFPWLARQVDRLASGYYPTDPGRSLKSDRNAFRLGCVARINARMRQARREREATMHQAHPNDSRALVVIQGRQLAEAYAKRTTGRWRTARHPRMGGSWGAYEDGRAAGDRVQLAPARRVDGRGTPSLP